MSLDQTFAALADPIRCAIVSRLAKGDATVVELAEPFAVSLPAISRHLKVLERAGLITRGRDAQRRPCSLRGESLGAVVEAALELGAPEAPVAASSDVDRASRSGARANAGQVG